MTVKELKNILSNTPDHLDVFLSSDTSEFEFGLLNSAQVREIGFCETPGGKTLAKDTVLVLGLE